MTTVAQPPKKGDRTIRVPLATSEYACFLTDRSYAKAQLDARDADCPAWFPDAFPGAMRDDIDLGSACTTLRKPYEIPTNTLRAPQQSWAPLAYPCTQVWCAHDLHTVKNTKGDHHEYEPYTTCTAADGGR